VNDDFAHPYIEICVPAKIRSAGNLSHHPQKRPLLLRIFAFLLSYTELQLRNIQANYWVGQMHCDPLNQNFGWPAHPAAPYASLFAPLAL